MQHYSLNANSLAKRLGYVATSKLYGILQGSAPSFGTLTDILEEFPEVSSDWMVLGRGPMLRGATDAAPMQLQKTRGGKVSVVTVDDRGNENTVFVPIPAQAGYTVQHNEAVYFEQLDNYRLPGFERGEFRAFEVAGDSMEPTINHRDVVVCSRVEELRLLEPGEVYVVVTSEAVMLKRIKVQLRAADTEVTLYSDNPHRYPYVLETRDIQELWRVRGYVSSYIPSAPDVTVERLWEVIEHLGFDRGEVRRHLEENAPSDAPPRI
ncbi:LexA family transcriptional regulator [Microvirga sp. STR05]|nr:LexA family transcriptional regulator [Hymenobacter duratus]MBR7951616.1 LexA family transcriptional regulator [Microvirga sp. STR05]